MCPSLPCRNSFAVKGCSGCQPFDFRFHVCPFLGGGSAHGIVETRVTDMVGRPGSLGNQPSLQFVHALGTGLEVGPAVGDRCLDRGVVAQFKMQGTISGSAPPVPAQQVLAPLKAEGSRHNFSVVLGNEGHSTVGKPCGSQSEEFW